jgi:hypothetical protein
MNLHDLFGTHTADLKASHWQHGRFVSACTRCDRQMVKLPGQPWRLDAESSR